MKTHSLLFMTLGVSLAACGQQPLEESVSDSEVVTCTTWDPAVHASFITLSNGNLTASASQQQVRGSARATTPKHEGKWYWEITIDNFAYGLSFPMIGIGTADALIEGRYIGEDVQGWSDFPSNVKKYHNSAAGGYGPSGLSAGVNDTIGVAIDLDGGELTFFRNGTSMGVAFIDVPPGVDIYPMVGAADQYFKATAHFASPFVGEVPEGFLPYDDASCGSCINRNQPICNPGEFMCDAENQCAVEFICVPADDHTRLCGNYYLLCALPDC